MAETVNTNGYCLSGQTVDHRDDRVRALQDEATPAADRDTVFASLYQEVNPQLQSFIGASPIRGESPIEVEDIAQETWSRAIGSIKRYRGKARFSTWVTSIAINLLRDIARADGRRYATIFNPALLTTVDSYKDELSPARQSPYGNPETDVETMENIIFLREKLRRLPEEQRKVIILRDFRGLSYEEIAELLEVSFVTVKSRIYEGREAIIKASKAEGPFGQAVPQAVGGIATKVELLSPA